MSNIYKMQVQQICTKAINNIKNNINKLPQCNYCRYVSLDDKKKINNLTILYPSNHKNIHALVCVCGFFKVLSLLQQEDIVNVEHEIYIAYPDILYSSINYNNDNDHHFITFYECQPYFKKTILFSIFNKINNGENINRIIDEFDIIYNKLAKLNVKNYNTFDIKRLTQLEVINDNVSQYELIEFYLYGMVTDSINNNFITENRRKHSTKLQSTRLLSKPKNCNKCVYSSIINLDYDKIKKDIAIIYDDVDEFSEDIYNRFISLEKKIDLLIKDNDENKKIISQQNMIINSLKNDLSIAIEQLKSSMMIEYNYEDMRLSRMDLHKEFKKTYNIFKRLIMRTYS